MLSHPPNYMASLRHIADNRRIFRNLSRNLEGSPRRQPETHQNCRFDPTCVFNDTPPMSATLEEVTRNALQLTGPQRLALAGFLLEAEDVSTDPGVAAAWEQEILDRIAAVDSGTVVGISYRDVMLEAESRFAP